MAETTTTSSSQFTSVADAMAAWAHALTDLALASHLQTAAESPRGYTAPQRKALMREAAARLEEGMR